MSWLGWRSKRERGRTCEGLIVVDFLTDWAVASITFVGVVFLFVILRWQRSLRDAMLLTRDI
jgi:hypothetical protein